MALYASAGTVLYLLEHQYPLIMAFFCGLVLASTWFLRCQVQLWSPRALSLMALGVFLTLLISFVNPLQGNFTLAYLFVCGAIAICAMILPGISGAYILLLLGVYDYVLEALRELQFAVIFVFAAGCAVGLLSFSHLLSLDFFLLPSADVCVPDRYAGGVSGRVMALEIRTGRSLPYSF